MIDSTGTTTRRRSRKSLFVILACVLFPALLLLSFLPPREKSALHTTGRFHGLGHVLAFMVIAYVAAMASRSRQARTLFFLMALSAGFAIEMGEHLVYGSALEWTDILSDSIGVLLGTLLALLSAPRPPKPARSESSQGTRYL